ncbi:hypothetical protein FBU30_010936 [Linnemannia zychae]|nr:hypothetical protein FBU30_010936 [Linnemannia zychae]
MVQASVIPRRNHVANLEKRGNGIITSCRIPGTIAMTFDDGPFEYTNQLLDILKENNVKATFFVNGDNIGYIYQYDWVVKRTYNEGHQIGSHTWGHANLATLTLNQIRDQMNELDTALKSIIGVRPVYMRPPYGALNDVALDYLNRNGYKIVTWNVDTNDWAHPGDIRTSLSAYTSAGRSGFIALEHDTHESTVNILVPQIIQYAKHRGWKLVTVGECLGDPKSGWYRA